MLWQQRCIAERVSCITPRCLFPPRLFIGTQRICNSLFLSPCNPPSPLSPLSNATQFFIHGSSCAQSPARSASRWDSRLLLPSCTQSCLHRVGWTYEQWLEVEVGGCALCTWPTQPRWGWDEVVQMNPRALNCILTLDIRSSSLARLPPRPRPTCQHADCGHLYPSFQHRWGG